MKALLLLLAFAPCVCAAEAVVVFQPSHQTDTGEDFNEAEVCGDIVDQAMWSPPHYREYKVWSYDMDGLHSARAGSNTMVSRTTAVVDGKISGYAWEIKEANSLKPLVFVSVHNNGGTGRHAVWGYIHDGDAGEGENRRLSNMLIEEIALATDLENRGTHLDSSAGRNDYRCAATGRQAFYSIDENVNAAPYRVILEIGDSARSREMLLSKVSRRAIGAAIKRGLGRFMSGIGSGSVKASR